MDIHAIGFDPSLRHGSMVLARFAFTDGVLPRLQSYERLYYWQGSHRLALHEDSSLHQVADLVSDVARVLPSAPGLPVAVDWDPMSVYWTQNRLQVVTLGLLIGYFTRAAHTSGHPVILIQPSAVRQTFSLKPKAPKQDVYKRFKVQVPPLCRLPANSQDDTMDAIILAYLAAKGVFNGQQLTSQAALLGGRTSTASAPA